MSSTSSIRMFDWRGEQVGRTPSRTATHQVTEPDRVELPLALWRRRPRAQSNVITLRIPSWASSSSKP